MATLRAYVDLTKPGIVASNALVAAAAYVYGSHGTLDWRGLFFMLVGLMCIVAAACVFNNYADRALDTKMARTRSRALAQGTMPTLHALLFGVLLLALGCKIMLLFSTLLALEAALVGFVVYVFMYTPLKPRTPWALFVGAIAGATPPVVGYAAAGNSLDQSAWLLFIFLFVWQLPHFISIAIYRNEEYGAAGIPLFVKGPFSSATKRYARLTFFFSLVVLLGWCGALVMSFWL